MIDLYDKGRKKFDWWPDWRGECVAVVCSGPSVNNQDLSRLRDRIHVVVVNECYRLCPWADVLYSCDAEWWRLRQVDVRKFSGLKITFFPFGDVDGLKKIEIAMNTRGLYSDEMHFDEPGVVGSGGHSGHQLTNLVAQFGATGIALVGMDLTLSEGRHWHGEHPSPLRNPDKERFRVWAENTDACAETLERLGIDVVNCSPVSSLKNFPKVTINEMLERWGL